MVVHRMQTADGRTDAGADSNNPRRTQGYLRIAPRMVRELHVRGFTASKERVERLMRNSDKRRFKATTDSKHALPVVWFRKKPAPGLIHHSDPGKPACGPRLQARL